MTDLKKKKKSFAVGEFCERVEYVETWPLWTKPSSAGTLTELSHPLGGVWAGLCKLELQKSISINVSRTKSAHLLTSLNSKALLLELDLAPGSCACHCLQEQSAPCLALPSLPSSTAWEVCPRGACPVRLGWLYISCLPPLGIFSETVAAGLHRD